MFTLIYTFFFSYVIYSANKYLNFKQRYLHWLLLALHFVYLFSEPYIAIELLIFGG